ncbi:MAG: caspase family protein [Gemmataceae bacterium]|nr:caspase family protein [Gemmataceae bacterium]
MNFRSRHVVAVLAVVALAAGRATAQPNQAQPNPNLKPTYGSVRLKAGFLPDPFTKDLQAGGQLRTNLGGVKAYVAKAPDVSLHYTKGQYPLTFTVKSVGDTTLLINLPDGTWVADDDSGGGLDPLIRIAQPQSGRYDIFVGTYRKGLLPATLYITELDAAKQPPPPVVVKGKLPDCYVLSAGVDDYRNANKLNGCLNDARNTAAAFRAQTGSMFRKVEVQTLLDASATRGSIQQRLQGFTKQGASRDYMVLFLSGHGGRTNGDKTWYFLPFDFHPSRFADTVLTDRQILDAGDAVVKQKKHFVVIVDACFSGQLHTTAQPYLGRYKGSNDAGMILMLSSAPHQTSAALGNFSAFAKALADAMAGGGDLNKDSKVTLDEIQSYSARRTAQLLARARIKDKQDCIVAWSPSISKDAPLAYAGKVVASETPKTPAETPSRWSGDETLPGYGKLSFAMYPSGRVVMVDARDTMEGIWRKQDNVFTLAFANGSVVYTGTLDGAVLSGTATSPSPRQQAMRTWNWTVRQQSDQ